MNSKKLAHEAGHIVFVHPSLMGGGAERVSLALASYFVSHGIRFTYFLTKSNVIEYEVPDGVEVCSEFADASLKPLDQVKLIRRFVSERPKATVISFLPHQNMYTLIATIGLPNRVIVSVRNDRDMIFLAIRPSHSLETCCIEGPMQLCFRQKARQV